MNTTAMQVLDLLSRQVIDADEAIRLLKAVKRTAGQKLQVFQPFPVTLEADILLEMAGLAQRPQFGFGNIIMR